MTVERTTSLEHLAGIVRSFGKRRVLVIGDLVADRFLYGEISRVSREAPVLILSHERTETVPGGAANCAMNLASLGAHSSIVGVVGDDEAGHALLQALDVGGVDREGVVVSTAWSTPTKVRILAGHAHSSRQQVIRVDYEGGSSEDAETRAALIANLRARITDKHALIVSDYNYGVAGEDLISTVRELASGKPVLIDSRSRLSELGGFTAATPNEDEVEHVLNERLDSPENLARAGEKLRRELDLKSLLITRGRKGMLLLEQDRTPLLMKAVGERDAVDVTGAGDTVIATYALGLGAGASFADSARLANHAGGAVVMKRGTATVTMSEILESLSEHGP